MKVTQIRALIVFLSINAIFSAVHNLKNYEFIIIPKGISEFTYKITYSPSGLLKETLTSPFIFMKFSEGLEFAFEENGEYEFKKKNDDKWLAFALEDYKNNIINLKLRNSYDYSMNFTFIDYSEEINVDLDTFLNWNYAIYFQAEYKPIPMTFNVDLVNHDSIVLFSAIKEKILNNEKFLYYCLNKGGKCEYNELKNLTAKKGEKYKFILNPVLNTSYVFYPILIDKKISEIDYGKTIFEMSNVKEQYFIIDTRNLERYIYYFLYVNNIRDTAYSCFVSEKVKENIIEEIDSISFINENTNTLVSRYKDHYYDINYVYDYLIIKIKNIGNFYPYKCRIYLTKNSYDIDYKKEIDIGKGKYTILGKEFNNKDKVEIDMVFSSSKNMILMESDVETPTNLIDLNDRKNNSKNIFIFVDPKDSISVKYSNYTLPSDFKFNYILQSDIDNYLNIYGPDSIFMRTSSHISDFVFNITYFFGLDKEYYLYAKKLFGNVEVYQINQELDGFTNISDYLKPVQTYETDDLALITNKLVKITGYQMFNYFNSYGSLYDIYLQKVDDSEYVQLNPNIFKFGNLVKLFKKGKKYYLNFTVDHYIKLDNNFLGAKIIFTDKNNNKQYTLSKENKIIKDLKGDNIIVESDKDALIYFYKIIPANSTIHVEKFDQTNSGKNMNLTITKKDQKNADIVIIKDFGFRECYPLISDKNWEFKNGYSLYSIVENAYDKLENELYEDEAYFVYIYNSLNKDNLPIFNEDNYKITIEFFNELDTNVNKYNFEVFPINSNPSYLFSKNKASITYQFFKCENSELTYSIDILGKNSYQNTINKDFTFNQNLKNEELLRHVLIGKKESLLAYHFHNSEEIYEGHPNEDYLILSVTKLDNILLIEFSPVYTNNLNRYHVIAAKKDNLNNKDSFSKPCYLANLMKKNDNIIVKTILEEPLSDIFYISLDINKLVLTKNDEIVVNIISENLHSKKEVLTFYKPIEIKNNQEEYTSIKLNTKTSFDLYKNRRFKYQYTNKNNYTDYLVFKFETSKYFCLELHIINDKKTQIKEYYQTRNNTIEIKLKKSGNYYFEFYNISGYDYYEEEDEEGRVDKSFIATIDSTCVGIIDLSKESYSSLEELFAFEEREPKFYKVQNLKKDKNVIFNYGIDFQRSYYYSEDLDANPIKVCNDNTKECTSNVIVYKFLKQYNYTIYFSYFYFHLHLWYNKPPFFCQRYRFTPISDKNYKNIKEGYYEISEQKIMILNIEEIKQTNLSFMNIEMYYYTYTNDIINNNNIDSLDLKVGTYDFNVTYCDKKYLIIIPMLTTQKMKGHLITTNHIFRKAKNKYTIPSKKNALIHDYFFFYNDEDEEEIEEPENPLDYNVLKVLSSPLKNLKNLGYYNLLDYNNIVLNNSVYHKHYYLYLYADTNKNEKEININVKTYTAKYSFFGAIDNNIWKIYKDLVILHALDSNITDLKELTPFFIRANSDYFKLAEYFNLYLSGIEEKISIYIRKLYGSSEFYECEADPMDKMNFSILTRPLSSCKNKKSLFNRFVSLGNNKILTGYLDYNSYAEAYIDFEDDNRIIKLSYANKLYKKIKNFAKYLKKNIEYNLIVELDYLIKLDPEYDAEITISGDKNVKINSNNPTGILPKGNFKIKSNKDAMVYFYGKLDKKLKQIKIENNKGKIIEIEVDGHYLLEYLLDFGFEGYMPSNLFFKSSVFYRKNPFIFFENIYEKAQTKLVSGEFLYLYYYDNDYSSISLNINYNKTNLNNPKNYYTFNLITQNEQNKYLIINNGKYTDIQYNIYYCKNPTSEVKMFYRIGTNTDVNVITFKKEENYTYYERQLYEADIKIRFESSEDFIFSYSFIDQTDDKFYKHEKWIEERKELNYLIINEITQKEKSNILSIKFNPNYKQSSTRYIIVVTKKDDNNTEEKFSDPCYITKLATEKTEGVKIINVYSVGENDVITADIDIIDILLPQTEYIVNIISQELRFGKKLNFYTPKTLLFGELHKDKDDGLSAGYVVLISIGCLIILIAIIIIIIRCIKKRTNNDLDKKAQEINQEKILN